MAKGMTSADYIHEHLTRLTLNLHTGHLGNGGFWTLNLDTLGLSILLGIIFLTAFYFAARKASSGVPGRWQNCVEMLIDWIDGTVKDVFHGENKLIGPLALTIFVWVFLMNFMDLIPVDFLPKILSWFGILHFRSVPTSDPMATFAMSLTVFFMIIYYNLKVKGFGGLSKEILTAPFGPWLFPLNIFFRLLEEFVKPLSLALRLFGNLFAGELVFILIAIMPWWIQWVVGGVWSIFHILIILIQAFIFMMLTVVYISMAHDTH